jgi:hypothetical protein
VNRYFQGVCLSLFAILVLGVPVFNQAASITIDHTRTDITDLSLAEILNAKNKLHIAYGHTSHGSQITDGMSGLVSFANGHGKGLNLPNNVFAWNNGGTGGALDLHDYAMGGDVGYYPDWVNNTHSYLGTVNAATGRGNSNADVNVIVWSWCGQAAGMSQQQIISNYLNPMNALESEYWGVKFVYMTCHLDGSGTNGNLNQRNDQIRQYCQANNKVLFDFAEIESYDPDGLTNYMALNANDNCDYVKNGVSHNWATEWQASHTQNVDWYNCSCAHSQSLNGNQKAYAAWALWNDIATPIWNGPGGGNYGLAASWTNKTVPNGVNEIARFSGGITAPSTVALDSSATLGMITFDSSMSYTLAGSGSLTLQSTNGDATINVNTGSHTIDVPVVINGNTVIGGVGSLNLSGGISGNHTLTVHGNLTATSIQVDTLILSGAGSSAVPEPSAFALLGMGIFGSLAWLWRRSRSGLIV